MRILVNIPKNVTDYSFKRGKGYICYQNSAVSVNLLNSILHLVMTKLLQNSSAAPVVIKFIAILSLLFLYNAIFPCRNL